MVRLRITLAFSAILFLFMLILMFTQFNPKRPPSVGLNPPMATREESQLIEVSPTAPVTATESKPDRHAARRALSRGLAWMSLHRADMLSRHLEAMHGGASPEFRRFAREFLTAAGDDAIPIVKSLIEECASDEAKFLMAAVLGETRSPDAIPVLKDLIAKGPGLQVTASALYSIGMSRTRDGLDYLTGWLTTARESKSKDLGVLLIPALSSIALHGADSLDVMVAEARRRGDEQYPSKAEVVAMIRGADAAERLRQIYSDETDWALRQGAAMALGSSARAEDLEWMARTEYARTALLAARNIPDIWEPTADLRRSLAERVLSTKADPERHLHLAQLLPADKARAIYERVTSMTDFGIDPRAFLISVVTAFADQPDLDVRLTRMLAESGLTPHDQQRVVEIGVEQSSIPGKDVGGGPMVARLLAQVKDPANPWNLVQLAMPPVMKSGISESSLSTALTEGWRASAIGPRNSLLGSVMQGAYPSFGSLRFTQPEQFLAAVLREESEPAIKLRAAYAYLVLGEPENPDPQAMRAISFIVESRDTSGTAPVEVSWTLPPLLGNWYARFGGMEDIPKLQSLPDLIAMSHSSEYRGTLRDSLKREMTRAIDAIKLRAN